MKTKALRGRLDVLMVERGLAESTQKALAMILAGEVQVDGQRAAAAGVTVARDARIELNSRAQKFASRGGIKLEGALDDFGVAVSGRVCLDVGSSTGGFTDCLLQRGAARVYAVDVNVEQLAWELQRDGRVIRVERNARELMAADVAEAVGLVVMDVSFISVTKVLAPAMACARAGADALILVKPQFELRREEIGEGGIVTDRALHERAIAQVREAGEAAGLRWLAVRPSKLAGAEGNQEYFLHARKKAQE
ncbi:MAG: TlyA family RNA methyltransferase [Candidatus Acidiferrum sp.]|jgi:23S rRNA (cytidine1920-2'-O)/16S rRNA (cytidine1409-2'-O)-methyltransferase